MRLQRTSPVLVLTLATWLLLLGSVVLGFAEKLKIDDEVEVFFLNEWRPGVVLDLDKKGNVKVSFQFGAANQERIFNRAEIRFAYENGAIAPARGWSDKSGKFKVTAAAIGLTDTEITLRKPDMSELTVKIEKLSDADQKFIKGMQKKGAGSIVLSQLPPTEEFDSTSGVSAFDDNANVSSIDADSLPASITVTEGGVVFATDDFFDRLGSVLPAGGPDVNLLASVESGHPSKPLPTRLYWASIAKKKLVGRQFLPPGEQLIDYHPTLGYILTFSFKDFSESNALLTLWEAAPSDKVAKPIVRWSTTPDITARTQSFWARILNDGSVLQRIASQEYVCWDTKSKNMRFSARQKSFFAPMGVLSPGRKYFALPEDKGLRIYECSTGNLLTTLPSNEVVASVSFSDDGGRIAVLGSTSISVFEVGSLSSPTETHQAEAIGTPFSAQMYWVGNKRVIVNTPQNTKDVLFGFPEKMALWNYEFDHNAISENVFGSHRTREVCNSHLVYAASGDSAGDGRLAVGAVKLPGPKVDEAVKDVNPDDYLLLKPGSKVRLDVQAGDHSSQVTAALTQKIRANNWVLSPNAEAVLTATMTRGKTQTVAYQFGGRSGEVVSATVTPYISSLQLMVGKEVAWQSGTSSGPPSVVTLLTGQSVQGQVDSWQVPNPGFFDSVAIPERIMSPSFKLGLGTTAVTNRGLVPKANTKKP